MLSLLGIVLALANVSSMLLFSFRVERINLTSAGADLNTEGEAGLCRSV